MAGENWFISGTGNDVLRGAGGNDILVGGYGGDTYVYASGDGNDLIVDGNDPSNPSERDTLQLTNIASDGVTVTATQNGEDLLVNVLATGETITVLQQFVTLGIERLTFANGVAWNRATIAARVAQAPNSDPTDITLAGGSVAENATDGTVVGIATGVDADAADTLSYSLVDNAGGRFAIDSMTGAIVLVNSALLDHESAASHTISVRVTDQGALTFDKSFTIAVSDINEAPTNATLSGGTVAENSANGTVVGTVTGIDPDPDLS